MAARIKVIAYGAYDRHNYGDLVFAIVAKRYLEADGRFSVLIAATKASDLSNYGALPTIPLKQALSETSDQPKTMLIVAGGECLTAQWESVIGYLAPQAIYYPIKATPYLIGHKAFIRLSRLLTAIPSDVPLVLGERDLPGYKVMYNGVGGNQISSTTPLIHDAIKQNLRDCSYISVRDRETSAELDKLDIGHTLVPDSAILISDMFPRQVDSAERGHIVFNISDHYAKRRIEAIAQQLTELNVNTGLKIALLSIGKAPGYGDDGPLDKLHSLLGDERAYRVDSGNIDDIINCIASSKLYCGTSLHGAITALAYAVPQVALLPQHVIKLSSFLETWVPKPLCGFAEVRQVSQIGTDLINAFGSAQRTELLAVAEAMKVQVRANFDHMISLYDQAQENDACETAAELPSPPIASP